MPRKRKGTKRESADANPPKSLQPQPTTAATATATVTATATAASTSAHATPLLSTVEAEKVAQTTRHIATASKRTRYLNDADEDRLGKLVSLERWIEGVSKGRGAAFCICGHLVQADPSAGSVSPDAFNIELSCIHPTDPSNRSHLRITFFDQLASRVAEPLLLLHRLGPPAIVYLSGFAAQLFDMSAAPPRVVFAQANAVVKMSHQSLSADPTAPTSVIWIEQLATPSAFASSSSSTLLAPSNQVSSASTRAAQHPIPYEQPRSANVADLNPEPRHSSHANDWFSTPAPSTNMGLNRPTDAFTTASASATLLPPPPPPPPPRLAQSSRSSPEAHSVVSSSSSVSPNPSRALSRQASASNAPAPFCRNAPNVKPRHMGNCLYTPISMVRDGERVNMIGVIVSAGDARRSSCGTRDFSLKITIADASCLSGTGYAKELARSITVMLFAQLPESIPQNVALGHIFAIRGVHIQMFSGKPQAVGKSISLWEWAIYDPVSGDVRASPSFPLASHSPPECSAEEMDHFRDTANWFSELQGVDANIVTRSSRPMLKLCDVVENVFFDTVVEVVKIFTHTLAPDLYVTDYTNHMLFYRGNDRYLPTDCPIHYPDHTDGWGHVFQISLWDSHATIAEGLKTGDIIRIQNVRPKLNPRGLLTGGLGSSTDNGIKIRTLKPTHEARIDLEHRRIYFILGLEEMAQEALADRLERQSSQSFQPAHAADQQAQQGAQCSILGQQPQGHPSRHSEDLASRATLTHTSNAAPNATSSVVRHSSIQAMSAADASTLSSTQSFPTPAQRQSLAAQESKLLKSGDMTSSTPLGTGISGNVNSTPDDSPDLKINMFMGPPGAPLEECRSLIQCKAPEWVSLTPLAELTTTSKCPGPFKVQACVVAANPVKSEMWGRAECQTCKRLIPRADRFCVNCGDEEGESLVYSFRFAIMLEEVDTEFVERKSRWKSLLDDKANLNKIKVSVLVHGRASTALLSCVDAKAAFLCEPPQLQMLRRFQNRLLHPDLYGLSTEQAFAVYSYPSNDPAGPKHRFALYKHYNVLSDEHDLL